MPIDFEEEKPKSKIDFESIPPQRIPIPKLESFAHGAAQGATFGLVDEAMARLGAAYDVGQAALGLRGDISWKDAVKTRHKSVKDPIDLAQAENPWSFGAGQLAGNVASMGGLGLAAKGVGTAGQVASKANKLLNPLASASLKSKLGSGAVTGALTGFGSSQGDLSTGRGSMEVLEDTLTGVGTGAFTSGLVHGAGKLAKTMSPTNAAKKGANIFLNTPEEITELYLKNPAAVKNAPLRNQLAREYQDAIEKLQGEVTGGSKASRDLLHLEGGKVKGSKIAQIMGRKADEILKRSEGVLDDPQLEAAIAWLRSKQKSYAPPKVDDDLVQSVVQSGKMQGLTPAQIKRALIKQGTDRRLSTNRIKDLIQSIDRATDFETAPGKFSRIDDRIKGDIRRSIDELLKSKSPAYTDIMKKVASDTELLNEAAPLAKNPAALANVMRRIETDQHGGGMFPREIIGKVDERLGSKLLERAKLSNAREAFDKSVTNGSRNVNFFSNMLKDVPVAKYLAPVVGGTVDKYGRKMTMAAVDTAAEMNRILQKQGLEQFLKDIAPIVAAAKQGNASAMLTMQLLTKSNPEAVRIVNGGN